MKAKNAYKYEKTDWNRINIPYSRIARTIDSFKN